jgi:hypothetical protein
MSRLRFDLSVASRPQQWSRQFVGSFKRMIGGNSVYLGVVGKVGIAPPLPLALTPK